MEKRVDVAEERLGIVEDAMKKTLIIGIVLLAMLGYLVVRVEMIGAKTSEIDCTLTGIITDDYRLKAAEIIDWNIKEGLSPVEIYTEWKEKQWMSSIGELKHVLSSDIGRQLLVDHFGEDSVLELEEVIKADR